MIWQKLKKTPEESSSELEVSDSTTPHCINNTMESCTV